MFEGRKKDMARVYCPKCGHYVASYDDRCTNKMEVKCRECKKLVVYYLGKVEIGEKPQRTTSSGMRFY